jgi:hypothetical protein
MIKYILIIFLLVPTLSGLIYVIYKDNKTSNKNIYQTKKTPSHKTILNPTLVKHNLSVYKPKSCITPKPFKTGYLLNPPQNNANLCKYKIIPRYVDYNCNNNIKCCDTLIFNEPP